MAWTNVTLRQRLGEAGYIATNIQPMLGTVPADYTGTVWERNGVLIMLLEHRVYGPRLISYTKPEMELDPDKLGVRNVNMHGDG